MSRLASPSSKLRVPPAVVLRPNVFVGIDPGLNGALAFYDVLSERFDVVDMPTRWIVRNGKRRRKIDAIELGRAIDTYTRDRPVRAFVEQVGAMPGQGVTSMFSFGRSVGVIDGELGGLGIEPEPEVSPRTWQKYVGLPPKSEKKLHRDLAAKIWPSHAHLFTREKDDGRADAALILHYGLSQEQTKQ